MPIKVNYKIGDIINEKIFADTEQKEIEKFLLQLRLDHLKQFSLRFEYSLRKTIEKLNKIITCKCHKKCTCGWGHAKSIVCEHPPERGLSVHIEHIPEAVQKSTPIHTLAIDIETFSSVDIKKAGVYKYASATDFEILIIAYKLNNDPVKILTVDKTEEFKTLLQNPEILKTAFNASFERVCLSKFFKIELNPDQWECTMAKAYQCGMAGGLDQIAGILRIGEKMKEGMSLIRYFCMPCKPTKINGFRTRNLPLHESEKFEKFKQYCIKDVELESEIRRRLINFPITETERQVWILDQQINDRGVLVDNVLVNNALKFNQAHSEYLTGRAIELTGLKNPRSVSQLKKWLEQELDEELDSLGKDELPELLKKSKSETVTEVIKLRQESSKASLKKYEAISRAITSDNKIRGMFQYYGASRSGRWSGKLVQLHNLTKNNMPQLDLARRLVYEDDLETLNICFESLSNTLSQIIRTSFIPAPGHKLIISDLSAIEARIVAWLAGEQWRLDVFAGDGKIYEASAARMFNIPIESITKDSSERYKGKVAELALGYQGGAGALIKMGALDMGIEEKELPVIISAWRMANPEIVKLWYNTQSVCMEALKNPGIAFNLVKGIYFQVIKNVLFVTLPSGRKLCYLRPRISDGDYGSEITYEGNDANKKWGRINTYGGKLVENCTQAIARDILIEKMLSIDNAGHKIIMHVHDELVIEAPESIEAGEITSYMEKPVKWAEGLLLGAESFETNYYKK